MFEVAHPSTTFVSSGNPKQTFALNNGVSVSDVNVNITKVITQNRAKRKRGPNTRNVLLNTDSNNEKKSSF